MALLWPSVALACMEPPEQALQGPRRGPVQLLIAWGCAAILALTSILFAFLHSSERNSLQRTEAALDMAKKSEAASSSSVKAAIPQSDALGGQRSQDVANSVYGVYFCRECNVNKMDFRSDGTVAFFVQSNRRENQRVADAGWKSDGNTVTMSRTILNQQNFTIKQDDLIDSRGNRWVHIR